MADENKLATFKWFTDTYTCGATLDGTLDLGIFNYPYYTTSDKVINYKDLIEPDYYGTSIADNTNFVDGENNKCILQSHIKELIVNDDYYTYKIGFQKTVLNNDKHCLYVKMIGIGSVINEDGVPPDYKIKIKIIIYDSDNKGTSHIVNIPYSTENYTYIIVPNINRVEIVGVSVYRHRNYGFIIQPHIEYSYTLNLRDYISAANNENDGDFNGSKITRGSIINPFVIGSGTPEDITTQKDLVILDNWINLGEAVNIQSGEKKICWAEVEYIIDNNTILIWWNYYDPFAGEEPIYALLSNSAHIIKHIEKHIESDYNSSDNSDNHIFIAFEELYSGERDKTEIDGLENYADFDYLPDTLHELVLTKFIDYGYNII